MGVRIWHSVERTKGELNLVKRREVAGYTLRDEISNLPIRNELQILNMGENIAERNRNYHEHLERTYPRRAA
jgi:hypothetical protein